MKREAVLRIQSLRPVALPPYTADEDDDCSKSVDEYLAFYDEQDPDIVRMAVERYIRALDSFRATGYRDGALLEGKRMKWAAARQMQLARLGALPPYTTDEDDDASRPLDEYLAFYEAQDPEVVRAAVERYIQALQSYRASSYLNAALDEVLQAQRDFIRVIPFACDSLPNEMTPDARKHLAKVFQKALADEGYLTEQRIMQELILRLVERPHRCD